MIRMNRVRGALRLPARASSRRRSPVPEAAEQPPAIDVLDSAVTYERLDRSDMRGHIAALDAQAREAWQAGERWSALRLAAATPSRVVVAGMGGSAIGADVVATLAALDGVVPVQIVRNYTPPRLDGSALVVATSVSGETEEALAVFRAALAASCPVIAITTGGTLARLATEAGMPLFTYPSQGPPRATFGYGVFALLAILRRLGVLAVDERAVDATFVGLSADARAYGPSVPSAANPAKQLAAGLHGGVPVIVGTDTLEVAARRWAAQLNENAKQWAFPAALPELDHNQIVGFGAPEAARSSLRVVLLDGPQSHPRNRLRVSLTRDELRSAGVATDTVTGPGRSPLETIVRTCYLGDWVSLYLAMLNGVDPTPVAPIDRLKAALS